MASDGIEHLKSPLEYGQRILDKKVGYMTSGPVIVLWYSSKDPDIYQKIAEAVGATEPISAQPGSLRYMLSKDSYEKADAEDRALYNSLHCSDSRDEGRRERDLWFPDYA
jgi:nucleoside-diphosphate kinase